MTALRLCAAVATLAFAVNTAFAHGDHEKTSYYVGDAERKCTADGDRCAGADHKPFVKYAPCCDKKKACLEDEHLGWGRFCIDSPKSYTEKCYKTGVRCMGEKNKPYVKYMPCCDEKDECVKAHDDWGSFCVPVKEETKKYEPVEKKKKVYKKKVEEEDEDDDYKKMYEKKYDSYYEENGSYGDYGSEEYGYGKGKAKKFEKKFNLFPNRSIAAGPGQRVLPAAVPSISTGLLNALGLPLDLPCDALAAISPAIADFIPANNNNGLGDVFLDIPSFPVCTLPGRGLSLAGARQLLEAACSRLRTVDPAVQCWIEQVRGSPVRMAVMESGNEVVVRQAGSRNIGLRFRFRGRIAFLQVFVRLLRLLFVLITVVADVLAVISPGA